MHDIEPYYHWRDKYVAAEDRHSPLYGREYDEFHFSNRVYNYYIHPQWDEFGSPTLYLKILYADYESGFAYLELIGEWNDCVTNDVMFLKREIIDPMTEAGIHRFVLMCGNVLNFHGDEDEYYQEWHEEVAEEGGWICYVNLLEHVEQEMRATRLDRYIFMGEPYNDINWRKIEPEVLIELVETMIEQQVMRLDD